MIAQLLPSLYSEYCDLHLKLQKLSDLINAYGGNTPSVVQNQIEHTIKVCNEPESEIVPVMKQEEPISPPEIIPYPQNGSWRAKMLYGLKHFGKPVTAKELAGYILTLENSFSEKKIEEKTSDYLCKLDQAKIIQSDRSDRPYKYSLLSS